MPSNNKGFFCVSWKLTGESAGKLEQGINTFVLSNWSTIKGAVINKLRGHHSEEIARNLASRVFNFFVTGLRRRTKDHLQDLLYDGIEEFHLLCDDGLKEEIEKVAERLMNMYQGCIQGNYDAVEIEEETKRELDARDATHQPAVNDSDEDEDEDEDEDDDEDDIDENRGKDSVVIMESCSSSSLPIDGDEDENQADDGGWVTVSSKKRSKSCKMQID